MARDQTTDNDQGSSPNATGPVARAVEDRRAGTMTPTREYATDRGFTTEKGMGADQVDGGLTYLRPVKR